MAGPVAVGVVAVPAGYNIKRAFPGVADSKQLTERAREALYIKLCERRAAGELAFCVHFSSALYIDKFGITKAVRRGVHSGVRALAPDPKGVQVLLDGLLCAPPEYAQQTIVRGDATEPIISLASIAAKVERDRMMQQLHRKYPHYGFAAHKGYGTKAHYAAIAQHGLCAIHRKSWCVSAQGVSQRSLTL